MTFELHEPAGATRLTPDELLGLKAKHIATRGELNELEGENIIAGLTWLDRRPKSFDLLTDAAVLEIHKRLFGEIWDWAGIYRLTDKNIGVPVWHISTELRTCLDDARYWRDHKSFDPLEATARLHHRLVWIHPFANGNGRWARIMADAYLARIDPKVFLDWSGAGTLNGTARPTSRPSGRPISMILTPWWRSLDQSPDSPHPNRLPDSVKVYSFTMIPSSMASSEVRWSCSASSWR